MSGDDPLVGWYLCLIDWSTRISKAIRQPNMTLEWKCIQYLIGLHFSKSST